MRRVGGSSLVLLPVASVGVGIQVLGCHGLEVADHDGERRAEFVGNVRDEILAHGEQAVELGHVPDQQERVSADDGDPSRLETPLVIERRDELDDAVRRPAPRQCRELGLPQECGQIAAAVGAA